MDFQIEQIELKDSHELTFCFSNDYKLNIIFARGLDVTSVEAIQGLKLIDDKGDIKIEITHTSSGSIQFVKKDDDLIDFLIRCLTEAKEKIEEYSRKLRVDQVFIKNQFPNILNQIAAQG